MKIIINNDRGREWENLDKYWLITKEKLERSDTDFELAFNRLNFIARSKVGLSSANVVINLLLYLSIMYKASYQSLSVLQSYEQFISSLVATESLELSELTMERIYHESFQNPDIHAAVSDELYVRFFEMVVSNTEKSQHLKPFFMQNNVIFLQLVAHLKQLAIGYQKGNEMTKRAFLFAKLLKLIRYVVYEQFGEPLEDAQRALAHDFYSIHTIIPNLKSKIGLFDFGFCMKNSKVLAHEFKANQENQSKKIRSFNVISSAAPKQLHVKINITDRVGSLRNRFDQGVVHLRKDYGVVGNNVKAQLYLARSGGSFVWRMAKCVVSKCVVFNAKLE